ncbi:hypothetical protein ACHAXN_009340 [Cyclotella atomus]
MIGPPPPGATAVRLLSVKSLSELSATSKILHLIRHAEGTHNLCEIESKKPIHHDAKLTTKGKDQCFNLSSKTRSLAVEAVLVSPTTRCLETATLSFQHCIDQIGTPDVPFIAYEEWRETVNYLCDSRRSIDALKTEFRHVDFQFVTDNHDPLWHKYEGQFGSHTDHTTLRESNDPSGLYNRAHSAWRILLSRPERELALVGHSAFFMHMFTPLFDELEGLVSYEDSIVEEIMRDRFDNCELRTVVVDQP